VNESQSELIQKKKKERLEKTMKTKLSQSTMINHFKNVIIALRKCFISSKHKINIIHILFKILVYKYFEFKDLQVEVD
jgi:hypothetical protein